MSLITPTLADEVDVETEGEETSVHRTFSDCDIETYYESVRDSQTGLFITDGLLDVRTSVNLLLHKTHRQMVRPTTSFVGRSVIPHPTTSNMTTAQALQLLDAGTEQSNSVQLIFTQTEMPVDALGTEGGWEPGYLWDIRNVTVGDNLNDQETLAYALSDLFNLRPHHINIVRDAALQGLFYGNCFDCNANSNNNNGEDTIDSLFHDSTNIINKHNNDMMCLCQQEQALQPPEEVRGEIARALLYMDLRYGVPTSASDGLDLILSDCPPTFDNENRRMGYFSRLVQWHLEYPPSDAEIKRNDVTCQEYQGNRNPFIDFPEDSWSLLPFRRIDNEKCPEPNITADDPLVEESTEQGITTPEIDVGAETIAPSEETSSSVSGRFEETLPCDKFMAGDISFNMIDATTNSFGLVALWELPAGMELFVTSKPWDSLTNSFREFGGSSIKLAVPNTGIQPSGKTFGHGDMQFLGDQWTPASEAVFDISTNGAELYVYCTKTDANINALAAISTTGREFASLPPPLVPLGYGVLVLPSRSESVRYRYTGPILSIVDWYAKELIAVSNWESDFGDFNTAALNSIHRNEETNGIGNANQIISGRESSGSHKSTVWAGASTTVLLLLVLYLP
ncbi:endonuclease I [Nitzschia inconspicua]|uniref:Endonuclease I n=1 Tax=Nitzschia inconspicua TaxID=303405 RepID=A0A9K3Q322_9STRA|nr:endonuclease I [Nitzschia inconspicua]